MSKPTEYRSLKEITFTIALLLFIAAAHAQHKGNDSTHVLSKELGHVPDTVAQIEDPPKEDQTPQDSVSKVKSIYFTDKENQVNGGGPDTILQRELPDSLMKRLKAADEFWYADYPFNKKVPEKDKGDESFFDTRLGQTLLWLIIVGGFVAFLIIYLSNSNIGLFRRAGKDVTAAEEEVVETDNIFEINYQREIDRAVNSGNYRFAVRLMFLRLLKNLADKNIIQYQHDRTNFDYLSQMHSTRYYDDFFRLTRNYEYSWYGQFDIEPQKFSIIRNDFESFDQHLLNR